MESAGTPRGPREPSRATAVVTGSVSPFPLAARTGRPGSAGVTDEVSHRPTAIRPFTAHRDSGPRTCHVTIQKTCHLPLRLTHLVVDFWVRECRVGPSANGTSQMSRTNPRSLSLRGLAGMADGPGTPRSWGQTSDWPRQAAGRPWVVASGIGWLVGVWELVQLPRLSPGGPQPAASVVQRGLPSGTRRPTGPLGSCGLSFRP